MFSLKIGVEPSHVIQSPAWFSKLRVATGVKTSPSHDKFRGLDLALPISDVASPLLTTTPYQREDVLALDRFSVHRCPTRRVFSGTGLVTKPATIRFLYHSATTAMRSHLKCRRTVGSFKNDENVANLFPCPLSESVLDDITKWLATLTAVPLGLGSNPGEDMDVYKCIVPSPHGGALNSRRAASPLVRDNVGVSILTKLKRLFTSHQIHLLWIPSHIDLEGNEIADTLAKAGARELPEPSAPLTFLEIFSRTKHQNKTAWITRPPEHHWYQGSRPGGSLAHGFTRQNQTLLARFRSGHIKSMKFSEGRKSFEMCTNCSSEPATPAHILECLGLTKQDLADDPLLVLDLLKVYDVMDLV
ncbi:RNase H domain-containing protein [Trichonephila clavipes]|nr:RNase H domain-containing protein [Trichonephila clavipes]